MNDGKIYDLRHESPDEELNYEANYDEGSVDSSVDLHEGESGPDPESKTVPNSSRSSQEAKIRSLEVELEKLKEEEKVLRLKNEEDELGR